MVKGNIDIAIISALKKIETRKSKELQITITFNQERPKNINESKMVTDDNDSTEEQIEEQKDLEEANQPGVSNIQE